MQTDTISHILISRFAEPSLRCVPAQPGEPEQIKGHHNRQQNVYQSAWYNTGHKHRLAQRQGATVALVWGKLEGNTFCFCFNDGLSDKQNPHRMYVNRGCCVMNID